MKHESPITYSSKAMANAKVFADKQTVRPKTISPQSIVLRTKSETKKEINKCMAEI